MNCIRDSFTVLPVNVSFIEFKQQLILERMGGLANYLKVFFFRRLIVIMDRLLDFFLIVLQSNKTNEFVFVVYELFYVFISA